MIFGIGTDIVEISRIAKALESKRFLTKYFTKEEAKLLKKDNFESIAGNFAVKEAFAKALGTGFEGFMPIDIEVLRLENGKPYIKLYNNVEEFSNLLRIDKIHVSLSHTKEHAVAFVILEN